VKSCSKSFLASCLYLLACFNHAHANSLIYTDQEWLSLNAYEHHNDGWNSHIRNADFFLTPSGQTNPQKELSDFIKLAELKFHSPEQISSFCRYPARIAFLKKHMKIKSLCAGSPVNGDIDRVQSISVLFADGYFGNPASYYGHVLLKLNQEKVPRENKLGLLDTAINYGAKIPKAENPVAYILKGVFGFYSGSFQSNKFFLNTVQYADQENRDFWAYDLNLDKQQSQQIARRAIELQNAEFDYYFFSDNCTHRVRDLISEVLGEAVADDNGVWFMPMQLLRGLGNKKNKDGANLITNVRYLPSPRTKLLTAIKHMSPKERRALDQKLTDPSAVMGDLSPKEKKRVLIAADIHLRNSVSQEADKKNKEALGKDRQKILFELFGLQDIEAQIIEPETPQDPHSSGRNGSAVSISAVSDKHAGGHSKVTIRPAYTDSLAPDIGKIADSTLLMAKIELTQKNSLFRLQKLTLIEIENLRVSDVPKRFIPGRVWHLSAGTKRDGGGATSPLKTYLTGGIGANRVLGGEVNTYFMVSASLQDKSPDLKKLNGSLIAGLIANIGFKTKAHIRLEWTELRNEHLGYSFNASTRTKISGRNDLEFIFNNSDYQRNYISLGIVTNF